MTTYTRKPKTVEAEQLLLEHHHPLLGGIKPLHIPEGMKTHKGCGYRMCDVCGGANPDETIYYLETSSGIEYAKNQDWVITEDNGEKHLCDNKTFRKKYEKTSTI